MPESIFPTHITSAEALLARDQAAIGMLAGKDTAG